MRNTDCQRGPTKAVTTPLRPGDPGGRSQPVAQEGQRLLGGEPDPDDPHHLADMHDEWQSGERRYLSDGSMAQLNPTSDTDTTAAIDSGA